MSKARRDQGPITGGRLSQGERAAMLAELLERGHDIDKALAMLRKRAARIEPRACQTNPFGAGESAGVDTGSADTSPGDTGPVDPGPDGAAPPAAPGGPPAADPYPSPGQAAASAPTGREPEAAAARPADPLKAPPTNASGQVKRRQAAFVSDAMVERMRQLYAGERRMSIREVGLALGLSHGTVQRYLARIGGVLRAPPQQAGGEHKAARQARQAVPAPEAQPPEAEPPREPIKRVTATGTELTLLQPAQIREARRSFAPYHRLHPIGPQPPARTCQFFTGPGLGDHDKCGAPSVEGRSWCAAHAQRCIRTQVPNG